ncbi:transketolase [Leptonema illini]|uniref:Transketolase n=1 Tax=Leptonema illini DSM 21528 TaxID=929563 RepID=H2CI19_9LEPT|nr:transketolase [Leptonema illini]EHQ08042.1 transketolase [Leptonema illini DSM 21528]
MNSTYKEAASEYARTATVDEEREMDRKTLANAIRALSIDAVEKANSGHPGAPMGMADMAEVLWNDFLRHNPKNPNWANRDRVVLSNGHASMLLYSALHLSGYDLTIDDLKNFRQLHSKTPGHPEYGHTAGVETTTGPLGQGITTAVGMALGEKLLASEFNRDGLSIVDHHTYVLVGDGCLMEGISHEAASLAGTWKLGKLIALYDDNGISIDGEVKGWFSEDVAGRFRSYGWQVIDGVDGHDASAVAAAIAKAKADTEHPTLICCKTVIGFGSPAKAGKESVHGAPLGKDEAAATKAALGWNHDAFVIPDEVYKAWNASVKGAEAEAQWNALFAKYEAAHPDLAVEFKRRGEGRLPANFEEVVKAFLSKEQPAKEATRKTSQRVLGELKAALPEMLGGSADLTHSNLTNWSGMKSVQPGANGGNYLHFGVREFAMAAIMNGLQLHGHYRPFGGTFLVFSDYMRNAMRLSALMKLPVIYVLTHDSIGLGEDGPTHQPVEHVPSLRLIPDLDVWRPANVEETLVAWSEALKRKDGPSAFILSRSNIDFTPVTDLSAVAKGAYVAVEPSRKAEQLIIATGSELPLAIEAAKQKNASGGAVRIVSMPCAERFDRQDAAYRESILNVPYANRYAIEAAHPGLWAKYAPFENIIGIDSFGASAPGELLMKHFGFTVENLLKRLG